MFDPRTVTLADPVPARFHAAAPVNASPSYDHASDIVPVDPPAVSVTPSVRRIPPAARHRVDVSDTHSVDSHAVSPVRPADV